MVDVLGYFGSACLIGAMLLRNMYVIKIFMLIGAIAFLGYAIILQLNPLIVLNCVLVGTGIFELIRLVNKRKIAK
ncbi:hypothetical protein ACFLXJ_03470 [Chloroflexota bacterium]